MITRFFTAYNIKHKNAPTKEVFGICYNSLFNRSRKSIKMTKLQLSSLLELVSDEDIDTCLYYYNMWVIIDRYVNSQKKAGIPEGVFIKSVYDKVDKLVSIGELEACACTGCFSGDCDLDIIELFTSDLFSNFYNYIIKTESIEKSSIEAMNIYITLQSVLGIFPGLKELNDIFGVTSNAHLIDDDCARLKINKCMGVWKKFAERFNGIDYE